MNRRCPWPCCSIIGNLLLIGRESPQQYIKQNHSFSSAFSCPSRISALFIWKVGLVPLGTAWGLSWRSGRSEASKKRRLLTVLCVLAWHNHKNKASFKVPILALLKKYNTPLHSQENSWYWNGTAGEVGWAPAQALCLPCSLVQGFLLSTPSLCSVHSSSSCWEVNSTKLVHRCKEALQKRRRQALLGFAPG